MTKKTEHHTLIPAVIVSMLLLSLPADALDPSFLQDDPNMPWHITADAIEYDEHAKQFTATGNVTLTKNDRRLSGDLVLFNHQTMEASAQGHVIMNAGEDILAGTRIDIDLKTETGTIHGASIYLKENHFHIKGDKIQKMGEATYAAHKASISACDGDVPAWKITGRNLKVTIEGYAFVTHAALWAKNIPVLYTPFFFFPVKEKRQSGLLTPQVGHSDRKGVEYNQPLYWAISDRSDATVYLHPMEKRGTKVGAEYRYVLDSHSKGAVMLDLLDDKEASAPEFRMSNFGFQNSDRYWFRMKHDQRLPFDSFAKLDIDIVGDPDYFHEFRYGFSGFESTEAHFNKTFGRELDDYNDPVRVSSISLNKRWDNCSLTTEARWYDDIISRRRQNADATLHKLPVVRFGSLKQRIPGTPLYWKVDAEYVHFHRKEGLSGHRGDICPRVHLPKRFGNHVTLESSLGLRETIWRVDEHENGDSEGIDRQTYDIRLELSSTLFRNFQWKTGPIRHVIKPRILYEYMPDQGQEKYPWFDSLDRIEKKNLLTGSIVNTVSSRGNGRRICRFEVSQSYDINEARETNEREKEPFSPTYGEIELSLGHFLSLYADAEWSHHESEFESRNFLIDLRDNRGDRIFVAHRYQQDVRESVYTDLRIKVTDTISLYADYERNLHDKKEIKNSLGVLYDAQCWSADIRHTNEAGDHRYAVRVNLLGLGGVSVGK